jgi:hypothetical protein
MKFNAALFLTAATNCNCNSLLQLRFLTDHIDHIHKALATTIPLIPMPQEKWVVCVPTSISARRFLQLGFMMETFIDVVDIFFWFLREIMTKWDLWYRRIL